MKPVMDRARAWAELTRYNADAFHIRHALTLEGVMRYFALSMGDADDAAFWATAGLLHDIDFEQYPDRHCQVAPELLRAAGADEALIHAVCAHAYGLCCDVKPEHEMEKILFATDELTGLIGAAARMRPSKSVMDMDVSSVRKKFKDKRFAAGCSRDVIQSGADMLGWDLGDLMDKTLRAMQSCEADVESEMEKWHTAQKPDAASESPTSD